MRNVSRLLIALIPAVMLWSVPGLSAAPADPALPLVAIKGFVIARDDSVLTVRHGDTLVGVRLTGTTVVTGVRASGGEIILHDLVRVEGTRAPDGMLVASRIDVVLSGDGVQVSRPGFSVFWNWVLNGSWSVPVR